MSVFITRPWMPGPPLRLQPEFLVPAAPAGSFIVGGGAGTIRFTGTVGGIVVGQNFTAPGTAVIRFTGTTGFLALGETLGFNVPAGLIQFIGNTASLGTGSTSPTIVSEGFAPALSELALDAWERCGIQAGKLTATHFYSMRRSMNLVLSRWSNRGINLWKVGLTTVPVSSGVSTYSVSATVIDVLDAYVNNGASDILLGVMSRNTYAALANKQQPGRPTQLWFDRTQPGTITLWPVPDRAYTLSYYTFSQISDADPTMGQTLDVPYRFLEAYTAALAAHLAIKWAPSRAVLLDGSAKEVWEEAAERDREKVTLDLSPDLTAYFR